MGGDYSCLGLIDIANIASNLKKEVHMNKHLKFIVYITSIAWLSYTLLTLPNTVEAQTNGIITAVVTLINMIVNDLNR